MRAPYIYSEGLEGSLVLPLRNYQSNPFGQRGYRGCGQGEEMTLCCCTHTHLPLHICAAWFKWTSKDDWKRKTSRFPRPTQTSGRIACGLSQAPRQGSKHTVVRFYSKNRNQMGWLWLMASTRLAWDLPRGLLLVYLVMERDLGHVVWSLAPSSQALFPCSMKKAALLYCALLSCFCLGASWPRIESFKFKPN